MHNGTRTSDVEGGKAPSERYVDRCVDAVDRGNKCYRRMRHIQSVKSSMPSLGRHAWLAEAEDVLESLAFVWELGGSFDIMFWSLESRRQGIYISTRLMNGVGF